MTKRLFLNFKKNKNNIALIDLDGHEYLYKDLIEKNQYISSKLKKNSLVVLICNNSADSIIAYTTLLRFNFLVILLDSSFDKSYITSVIKKFKPQYVFHPKSFFQKEFMSFSSILISLKSYDILKTNYKGFAYNKKNYLLLTTSGSTHNPKLVRLSAENLKNNSDSIINYLDIKKNYVAITTMPMGYSYGLSIINTHLEAGAKIVLNKNSVFEKSFWNKIDKYGVNSLNGVPQFYDILKRLNFHKFNLKSFKYFTQAGGKIDKYILRYLNNLSKKIQSNYL
jgi:long-chain acyl-CoA synthetase